MPDRDSVEASRRSHRENAKQEAEPVYPHADEPWAPYYVTQNGNWACETRPMARWKLGSSRKATAIETWELREEARLEYVAVYGDDPDGWPERHLTVVVYPTNMATPVCIECLWLDGDYWEDRCARTAGRLHTPEGQLERRDPTAGPGNSE